MPQRDTGVVPETEAWFVRHGLPYFVDDLRADVHRELTRPRLVPVLLSALVAAAGVWVAVVLLGDDPSLGPPSAMLAGGAVLVLWALTRLHVAPIAGWAVRRTFASLSLLFPLVTRALPLLLLFVTFLFINAEVWQVASALDGGVLWVTVLLFAGVAVAFLLVRLPEELDRVDDELSGERLVRACTGTPLEGVAREFAEEEMSEHARVTGLAKANLVLVLLVSQALQVLLLSVAVFGFFLVFGAVAIDPGVVESWIGAAPTPVVPGVDAVTRELLRVSVFLAGFSGLYFTVYAVSDETYRTQFFTALVAQLERAAAVRAVYRSLRAGREI